MTITINASVFWFVIGIITTLAVEIALGMIISNKEKNKKSKK